MGVGVFVFYYSYINFWSVLRFLEIQGIIPIAHRSFNQHVIPIRHVEIHASLAVKPRVITFTDIESVALSSRILILVLKERPPRIHVIPSFMNPIIVGDACWKVPYLPIVMGLAHNRSGCAPIFRKIEKGIF